MRHGLSPEKLRSEIGSLIESLSPFIHLKGITMNDINFDIEFWKPEGTQAFVDYINENFVYEGVTQPMVESLYD